MIPGGSGTERHGGGAYDYRRGLHCSGDTQAAYCRPVLSSGSLGARLRSGQTFTPGLGHHGAANVWQSRRRPPLISYARSNLRWTVPHAAQILCSLLRQPPCDMAYRGNTVRSGITKILVATYIVYILTVSYIPMTDTTLTNSHGRCTCPNSGSKVMR